MAMTVEERQAEAFERQAVALERIATALDLPAEPKIQLLLAQIKIELALIRDAVDRK